MRRRLLLTTVLIAVVTATLFGVPITVLSQRFLEAGRSERVELDAQRAAHIAGVAVAAGRDVSEREVRRAVHDGIHVVVRDDGRTLVEVGPPVPPDAALTREVSGPGGILAIAREPRALVAEEVEALRLAVVGFGIAAVLVAVAIGVPQARRLSRSLVELAEVAERLGSGDPRPQGRRYGVSELDRVAEVLDSSAGRIAGMLAAERQLSQDASHQLRTPLTALSMRLEEIQAGDDVAAAREEATIALAQVERLSSVVDQLLSRQRGSHHRGRRTPIDVDEIVEQQVAEWRPAYDAADRHVDVTGDAGLRVLATPGAPAQVLATLLENALHHGGGTVVLRRRTSGRSVVVEVCDEGAGVSGQLGQRVFERSVSGRSGTGLGLALARDLTEADGGRLELVSMRPAVFAVFWPQA